MGENEEKPADGIDALHAMAQGADLEQYDAPVEQLMDESQRLEDQPPEQELEGTVPLADELPAPQVDMPAPAPSQQRQLAARRSKEAFAVQYRRMMVPLMIIVGAILIVLGVVSVLLKDGETALSLGSSAVWFAMLAVPMGLILLLGARHFKNELKSMQK